MPTKENYLYSKKLLKFIFRQNLPLYKMDKGSPMLLIYNIAFISKISYN